MIGHLQKAGMTMTPGRGTGGRDGGQYLRVHRPSQAGSHRRHSGCGARQGKRNLSGKPEADCGGMPVPAFPQGTSRPAAGGGRLHRPGPDHPPAGDHHGSDEPDRAEQEFRGRQMQVRSGLGNAALPPDTSPHRLHQDSGGLQPRMRLLHHSDDPRTPPQPLPGGRGARGGSPWSGPA